MKMDIHYYATYTLARINGLNHKASEIIAFAAQYVDDAKHAHELFFENGGRMKQILSAHKYIHPKAMDASVTLDVYIPFHFLPACVGETYKEKLICSPESKTVKLLAKFALENLDKVYGIHLLGVVLHVIADTYSHSGFSAVKDIINDTSNVVLPANDYDENRIFKLSLTQYLPNRGHIQLFDLPDESNIKWCYENGNGDIIKKNNIQASINCLKYINDIFSKVKYYNEDLIDKTYNTKPFKEYSKSFKKLLSIYEPLDRRTIYWDEALSNGRFGFESVINYDKHRWFDSAVRVDEDLLIKKFYRKKGYQYSNWKLFQDALKKHKNFVQIDLLGNNGIYI